MDPTEAQSPGNGMGRGDAEINNAAEFSLASLLNRTHNVMLEAPGHSVLPRGKCSLANGLAHTQKRR